MRIKTLSCIILTAAAVMTLAGCGNAGLEIKEGSASQDGVTVTLENAAAEKKTDSNNYQWYEYAFDGTIENNSDEGIMKVIYCITLYNEEGEDFRTFGITYDGEDEAIPPGGKVGFSHDGIKHGVQDIPVSVTVGISSVSTESELPPVKSPEEGDYLYQALGDDNLANIKENPPVGLSFHIDQNGYGQTAVFEKGAALDRAVELLCGVKIVGETDEWISDNYNWVRLTWEDGTESYISFNMRSLEYSIHSVPHMYDLDDLDAFWSYASGYLTEDEENADMYTILE